MDLERGIGDGRGFKCVFDRKTKLEKRQGYKGTHQ